MANENPLIIGSGVAAFALASGMLSKLNAKGILTDQDVAAILGTLISTHRKAQLSDSEIGRAALQLLEGLAASAGKTSKPTKSTH